MTLEQHMRRDIRRMRVLHYEAARLFRRLCELPKTDRNAMLQARAWVRWQRRIRAFEATATTYMHLYGLEVADRLAQQAGDLIDRLEPVKQREATSARARRVMNNAWKRYARRLQWANTIRRLH